MLAILAGEQLPGPDRLHVRVDAHGLVARKAELSLPQPERAAVANDRVADRVRATSTRDHAKAIDRPAAPVDHQLHGQVLGAGVIEELAGQLDPQPPTDLRADLDRDHVGPTEREHLGRAPADRHRPTRGHQPVDEREHQHAHVGREHRPEHGLVEGHHHRQDQRNDGQPDQAAVGDQHGDRGLMRRCAGPGLRAGSGPRSRRR